MAPQYASPDDYVLTMQKALRQAGPVSDQQQLIASQKSMTLAVEELAAVLKGAGVEQKQLDVLLELTDVSKRSAEGLEKLQKFMDMAQQLYLTNSQTMQETLNNFVTSSNDDVIKAGASADKAMGLTVEQLYKKINEHYQEEHARLLFAEDEERKEKIQAAERFGYFQSWADKTFSLLDKFLNDYTPKWEDLFKIAWALWAPQILKAFRWGVEHLNEIGKFQLLAQNLGRIASVLKNIPIAFKSLSNSIKALISLPGKMSAAVSSALKGSETLKVLKDLSKEFQNSKAGAQLNNAMLRTEEFLGGAKETVSLKMNLLAKEIKSSKAFTSAENALLNTATTLRQWQSKFMAKYSDLVWKVYSKSIDVFDAVSKRLTKVYDTISSIITNTVKAYYKTKNQLGLFASKVQQAISPFTRLAKAVGQDLYNVALKAAKIISNTVGKVAGKLTAATGKVTDVMGKVSGALKGLGGKLGWAGKLVSPLGSALKFLAKKLGWLTVGIDAFFGYLRTTGNTFDKMRGAVANVIAGLTSFVGMIMNFIPELIDRIPGLNKMPGVQEWIAEARENKMTDLDYKARAGSLVGLHAKVGKDGKIGYETLESAGMSYTENMADAGRAQHYNEGDAKGQRGGLFGDKKSEKADFGERLAKEARSKASSTSQSKCGLFVGNAVERTLGAKVANALRGNGKDWARNLSNDTGKKYFDYAGLKYGKEMKNLPAGSIVSWPAIGGHKWGHVEIADGKGQLISDFYRSGDRSIYRDFPNHKGHVFVPKGVDSSMIVAGSPSDPDYIEGSDESSLAMKEEEPYTFQNALDDIMAFAGKASNEASDKYYGSSTASAKSSSGLYAQSQYHADTQNAEQVIAQAKQPAPIILPARSETNGAPIIDDVTLIMNQMALPTT